MKILVINAGSSSLKYQLIDMDGEKLIAKGVCERIGIDGKISGNTLSLIQLCRCRRKGSCRSRWSP